MAEEDPSVTIAQLQDRIKKLEEDNRRWMRLAGTNRLTNLPNSLMLYRIVLPTELRKYDGREVSLACLLIAPDERVAVWPLRSSPVARTPPWKMTLCSAYHASSWW